MILPAPGGPETGQPQFLVLSKGMWRSTSDAPAASRPLKEVKESTEKNLKDLMKEVGGAALAPNVWPGLAAMCRAVLRSILPVSVERLLSAAAAPPGSAEVTTIRVYIHPQLEWIPWEIMYDGTDYLGLRFHVARLPIVQLGPDPDDLPHPVRLVHNLLGENVVATNDTLYAEWQSTFAGLIGKPGQQEVRRPMADDWPLLDALDLAATNAADIVHLTCHGGLIDAQGLSYWTLNDKTDSKWQHRIYSSTVEGLNLTTKPLVFGNACASSQAVAANEGSGTFPTGLGTEFFNRGALAFVGTFAPITKAVAFGFARRFYEHLLHDGFPVGRALWATKLDFRTNGEKDPSWLFYCLYGPPETQFL